MPEKLLHLPPILFAAQKVRPSRNVSHRDRGELTHQRQRSGARSQPGSLSAPRGARPAARAKGGRGARRGAGRAGADLDGETVGASVKNKLCDFRFRLRICEGGGGEAPRIS